jgi:DNA-binding MarR family transcriptional regulator
MSTARRARSRADLEERLTGALRRQVVLAVLFNQSMAAQAGINPADLQCLNLLSLNGPMTPSRLAEAMAMTKGGAITAMVDRLETAGYLRRVRDTADRRQVLLETVPGEPWRQLTARYTPVGEALAGILTGYSHEQLELIADFTAASNEMIRQALPVTQPANSPDAPRQGVPRAASESGGTGR